MRFSQDPPLPGMRRFEINGRSRVTGGKLGRGVCPCIFEPQWFKLKNQEKTGSGSTSLVLALEDVRHELVKQSERHGARAEGHEELPHQAVLLLRNVLRNPC